MKKATFTPAENAPAPAPAPAAKKPAAPPKKKAK